MTKDHAPVRSTTCPMYHGSDRCNGTLNYRGAFNTDMGIANGVDRNDFTEYFVCATCGAKVQRTYQWMVSDR